MSSGGTTWHALHHAQIALHAHTDKPPYVYVACQELLMDMPFMQAK